MTFRQIEYFMAIAEYKNFSSAARKLYVSQPAISQQLSMMEQELGFSLFLRSKRLVELTPAGQIFYEACQKLQGIYQEALARISSMLSENTGQLTIGILEGLSIPELSEAVKNFSFQHYEDAIRVESHSFSGLTGGLASNRLDVIITILLDETMEHIKRKCILQAPCILVISKNHPLADVPDLHMEDFDDDIFYQIANEELPTADSFMSALCNAYHITPQKSISVPNPSSMLLMLESGSGVGVLDKFCYPEIRKYNSFRSIEIDMTHDVNIAWNHKNGNPLIPVFLKYVEQELSGKECR